MTEPTQKTTYKQVRVTEETHRRIEARLLKLTLERKALGLTHNDAIADALDCAERSVLVTVHRTPASSVALAEFEKEG